MSDVMAGNFVHQGGPEQSKYVAAAIDARKLEQSTKQDMAKQVTETNVDNIRQNSLRAEMRNAMRAEQPATYTKGGVMTGSAAEQQAGAAAAASAATPAPAAQAAAQVSSRIAASLDVDA